MRLHIGPIPEDRGFLDQDPAWRAIKEPSAFWAQVISLPLGALATGALVVLILMSAPHLVGFPSLWTLLALVALFPVHEVVHLLFHPRQGRSEDSLAGFWPRTFLFYAHWCASWPKRRFLACSLGPFLLLSVVPTVIAGITGLGGPTLGWFIVLNAMASSVDLLGSLLLLQVPSAAHVRNAGWKTYWKQV
jgi:hypothetical protein